MAAAEHERPLTCRQEDYGASEADGKRASFKALCIRVQDRLEWRDATGWGKPMSRWLTLACTLTLATPAAAAGLTDWTVSPASVSLGDWTATLGGSVSATGYSANQDGGIDRTGTTASALLNAQISRTFDNGWEVALHAVFLPYHDQLSGDNYGNRFFEKDYVSVQTAYGRVEIGQQDGAAYSMSITGPKTDDPITIDDANVTYFRDPTTGEAFTNIFQVRTGVFASANDGKLSYYTPRLFGIQLGASYTPDEARHGLPFVGEAPQVPDRETNILEAAANYNGDLGAASLQFYSGLATGHDDARKPGHNGLLDWGFGGEADMDMGDVKLALGAGYRLSNAYTFDIDEAFHAGNTHAVRVSATATKGAWIAGLEYSDARAGDEPGLPGLHESGYQPSVGYVVNANLQLTLGWQHLRFTRDSGDFYDGKPDVSLQAVFLHLQFKVS
jgi:hypothetical protein